MAIVTSQNADGSIASQQNTNPGAGGGGGSSTPAGPELLSLGHYWNSAYSSGTSGQLVVPVVNANSNGLGVHPWTFKAQNVMTIIGLEMFEAGPCSGVHQVEIRKNGVSPGVVTTMGNGTNGSYFVQTVSIPIAIGDTITAYVAVGGNGNTQSTVFATVQITPN